MTVKYVGRYDRADTKQPSQNKYVNASYLASMNGSKQCRVSEGVREYLQAGCLYIDLQGEQKVHFRSTCLARKVIHG